MEESLLHRDKVHSCYLTWNSFPIPWNRKYWNCTATCDSSKWRISWFSASYSKLLICIKMPISSCNSSSTISTLLHRLGTTTCVHQHSVLGKTHYSYLVLKIGWKRTQWGLHGMKNLLCMFQMTYSWSWKSDCCKILQKYFLPNTTHTGWYPHFFKR